MTTPLQIARYDRLVRRLMNLVGEGSIVTGALPDVFPVLELENNRAELAVLSGWRLGQAGDVFTGAAGQFPALQVFNPVASGVLVVVTQALVSIATAQSVNWRMTGTARPTLVRQFTPRDSRVTGNLPSQMRRESSVVPIPLGMTASIGASDPTDILAGGQHYVLLPGNGFEVANNVAASTFRVVYSIRERAFEASEDNF